MTDTSPRYPLILGGLVLAVTLWSVINPHDMFTWSLEAAPAILAVLLLASTYHRFRLTDLLYTLIALHCIVLLIGSHYTYAEVPLFNWLRDHYHLERNYYDRLGHLMQGFVPALIIRELLLRTSPMQSGKWLTAIIVFSCLGISAVYELIEWMASLNSGEAADAFLGTQGDVWDTQKDMGCAFIGAIVALALFSRMHDRALASLKAKSHHMLKPI